MQARHQAELLSRLERVTDIGCAEIRGAELLIWYDQKRTSKTIWRDLAQRWKDLLQEHPLLADGDRKSTLFVASNEHGHVLIWGNGLSETSNSWFKDVNTLAA